MNNQAFDEAVQRIVAEETLPCPPDAWRSMSARLDAHDGRKRKVFALTPAVRWAAAATLIGLALATGWMLRGEKEEAQRGAMPVAQQQASGDAIPEEVIAPGPTEAQAKNVATPPARSTLHAHKSAVVQSGRPDGNDGTSPGMNASPSFPQAASVMTAKQEEPARTAPHEEAPTPLPAPHSRVPNVAFAAGETEDMRRASGRRTVLDINGGFGSGTQRATFALGVAVKKSLGERLQFEGGLAVVSAANFQLAGNKSEDAIASSPTGLDTSSLAPVQQQEEPEESRAAFAYLQASPTLSYRIYKGFSAGAGLDAQRLLTAAERGVAAFNAVGAESAAPQPEWDFGLAARADYNVSQRLRLGVLYRESIRATNSRSTRRATGRDYFLVRLSYALF